MHWFDEEREEARLRALVRRNETLLDQIDERRVPAAVETRDGVDDEIGQFLDLVLDHKAEGWSAASLTALCQVGYIARSAISQSRMACW